MEYYDTKSLIVLGHILEHVLSLMESLTFFITQLYFQFDLYSLYFSTSSVFFPKWDAPISALELKLKQLIERETSLSISQQQIETDIDRNRQTIQELRSQKFDLN